MKINYWGDEKKIKELKVDFPKLEVKVKKGGVDSWGLDYITVWTGAYGGVDDLRLLKEIRKLKEVK